jgi:tRNA-binding protein
VGTIVAVEEVPKSSKLARLTVDFGDHRRTILAGIRKERANPREIEGRQALFVVNLPRARWRARPRRACCSTSGSRTA